MFSDHWEAGGVVYEGTVDMQNTVSLYGFLGITMRRRLMRGS